MRVQTLTVDPVGQILAWSEDAEKLLGYSELEVVGQSVETIIPPHLRGPHSAGFRRFVKTGQSRLPETVTTPAPHKSGAIVRQQISVKAVHEADGEIIAVDAVMMPQARETVWRSRVFKISAFGTFGPRVVDAMERSPWVAKCHYLQCPSNGPTAQLGRPARRRTLAITKAINKCTSGQGMIGIGVHVVPFEQITTERSIVVE
jgi:PAS domain S-box-containing protein